MVKWCAPMLVALTALLVIMVPIQVLIWSVVVVVDVLHIVSAAHSNLH